MRLIFGLLLVAFLGQFQGRAQPRSEYEVKALFFVTLARYTQWPTNAFASPTAPLTIGILGEDPFEEHLDALVKKEGIQGRPLSVRRYGSIEEVENCQMLFFGEMPAPRREVALARLRRRPVLTVSDRPNFAEQGGMIEMFVNAENKIRLKVAKSTITRAGLGVSPALLRIAQVVAVILVEPSFPEDWITRGGEDVKRDRENYVLALLPGAMNGGGQR